MTEHEEFVGNLKTVTNLLTWTLGLLSDHLKKVISTWPNLSELLFIWSSAWILQTKSLTKCEYVKTSTITLVLLQIISDDNEEEGDNKNQVYTIGSITKSLLCHLSRDKSLFREQTASLLDKAIRVVNSSHMLVVWLPPYFTVLMATYL